MPTPVEHLKSLIDLHLSEALREACYGVIYHPIFPLAYGSAGEHHAYAGGLAVHTLEVLEAAIGMAKVFPDRADMEVVVTAAVFHDFLKIYEYMSGGNGQIIKTDYRKLIRHVAGSHAEFVRVTYNIPFERLSEDRRLKIQHAILAHHGKLEYGSPILPQLIEAYIVNFADQFSVHFGAGAQYRQRPSSVRAVKR